MVAQNFTKSETKVLWGYITLHITVSEES